METKFLDREHASTPKLRSIYDLSRYFRVIEIPRTTKFDCHVIKGILNIYIFMNELFIYVCRKFICIDNVTKQLVQLTLWCPEIFHPIKLLAETTDSLWDTVVFYIRHLNISHLCVDILRTLNVNVIYIAIITFPNAYLDKVESLIRI